MLADCVTHRNNRASHSCKYNPDYPLSYLVANHYPSRLPCGLPSGDVLLSTFWFRCGLGEDLAMDARKSGYALAMDAREGGCALTMDARICGNALMMMHG